MPGVPGWRTTSLGHGVVILSAELAADPVNGVIMVELHGLLNVQSAATLRAVLLKCLVQGPDAVIVDVADLRLESRSRLTVFPAALRTNAGAGVTLLLCNAGPELRAMMHGGVLGDVRVHPTRAAALTAVSAAEAAGVQRISRRLGATAAAASQARQLVNAACREWALDELEEPATLVISELVSNAVQHAGTDLVVRMARRGDYLHLSVQDGSRRRPLVIGASAGPDGPPAERGLGLHLVDTYAAAWGSSRTADGKTVWATLRVTDAG